LSIIYEVEGTLAFQSEIHRIERIYGADAALDAIAKLISKYSAYKDEIKTTSLNVCGGPERKGITEYDPDTSCKYHSDALWRCMTISPPTVVVEPDGIGFTGRG
jgi:hypothetical protein